MQNNISNTLEIVFARQRKYLPNKVSNKTLCYVTMFVFVPVTTKNEHDYL